MIISRTISRVFVFSAVFSAIALVGSPECPFKKKIATAGAIALATALPEDADAAKAALETAGVFTDQVINAGGDVKQVNPRALTLNFVVNLGARKVGRCLAANGVKIPNPDCTNPIAKHTLCPL